MEAMVRSGTLVGVAALALVAAGAGSAAAQPEKPPVPQEQLEARYRIAAMEAALEQAVQLGASNVNIQLQSIAPDMVFLTGAPRARGFRLENYGLFFDVDVPVMRRSLQWTFRVLQQNDSGMTLALRDLKRKLQTIGDPALRQALEGDVQRIERQVPVLRRAAAARPGAAEAPAPTSGAGTLVAAEARRSTDESQRRLIEDPNEAYTEAVKDALINAMLDYSSKVALAPTDWLTVAARDQEGARRALDPYGVSTILLRVKGADLKAFHANEIGLAEARARVEVREY